MNASLDSALARLPRSVVAYDIESSGLSPEYDQIFQIAAIRTDRSFADPRNSKNELELRARRQPWVVPSPAAMLVTRQTPQSLDTGLLHHEIIALAEDFFRAQSAIYLSFNGLRFDEHILRHALFRSVRPPYLTQSRGSTRADLLVMARTIAAIEPSALTIPTNDVGRPTFRLGPLCRANGVDFPDDTAHDAVADVRATLGFARRLRELAPAAFDETLALSDKSYAQSVLHPGQAIYSVGAIGGHTHVRARGVLAHAEDDPNAMICVDLAADPLEYLDLRGDRLQSWIDQRPAGVSVLRVNAQPMVFPVSTGNLADRLQVLLTSTGNAALPSALLSERATLIAARKDFVEAVHEVLATKRANREIPREPDAQLYSEGLPPDVDILNHARVIRRAFPNDRPLLASELRDPRLREFALRICYEEGPTALDPPTQLRQDRWKHERLLGPSDAPWRTIASARSEIEDLSATIDPADAQRLREIAAWLDELEAEAMAARGLSQN